MPFRAVNRRGLPGYLPDMQRHHLLPCQLLDRSCFGRFFDTIERDRIGFDDFRANGLLLPASGAAALRAGLPMHRGPHRTYNEMVAERVGQIEAAWVCTRPRSPRRAFEGAVMQVELLQRALRRRLMQSERRLCLSRRDPFRSDVDFGELDAMAELLWTATASAC